MNLVEIINDLRACTLVRDCTKKINEYNNESLRTLLALTYNTDLPATWDEIEANLRYVYAPNDGNLESLVQWINANLDVDKQVFIETVCAFLKHTTPESNAIAVGMLQGDLGIKLSRVLARKLRR